MGHREQLLAAARQLLEDKGYAHITARDLVAASGTNLASIGYHFGSKAGLLNAALGTVFEEWTTQLAEVAMADPSASPIERAHRTWAALLDMLSSRRALLLSFMEALAQADRDPADPRCTSVASWVMAVCDGLSIQWLLDPANAPNGADLLRGLAELHAVSEGR